MASQDPLPFVKSTDKLADALNDHELNLGHKVLTVFGKSGDGPSDRLNIVTYDFDISANELKRLRVVPVPAGATADDADKATTPEAAQAIKEAFMKFIAPIMESAEAFCRAEVFVNNNKIEVVVLRDAEPLKPLQLGGTILKGSGDWGWTAEVIGNDIVVQNAKTTAFGGDGDKGDNGETACGFPTKGHPDLATRTRKGTTPHWMEHLYRTWISD